MTSQCDVIEIFVNIFRKSLLHTDQIWLKNVEPFFNKIISKTVYELLKHPLMYDRGELNDFANFCILFSDYVLFACLTFPLFNLLQVLVV